MNEVWNLEPIYKGFSDPAFARDYESLKALVQELKTFSDGLEGMEPLAGLTRGIALAEELTRLVEKLIEYASLRQSADTRDQEAGSQMGRIMALYSDTAAPLAAFSQWASSLENLQELVAGDENLRDYGYYFENMKKSSRYLLPGMGEEIMARMELSGGNAWADLHSYITSTLPVKYRDKTINLSAVRNLAYDEDAQVRKDAYEAELAAYPAIRDSAAFALNSIKLETISDCKLRGYTSPLDRTLENSHMEKKTLTAMLEAMDEYLPKFWQYLKAKGKALGHENGLPWYDLFAPMGKASTRFSTEDARNYLVKLFSGFDRELADMVAKAFDEAWIDFYPRDGKVGGAFCAEVECLGESRILTNFDGLFTDVVTLAHELGHAFHNQCIRSHRPLNHDYSMPVAETASTFNECVVMAAAIAGARDTQEQLSLSPSSRMPPRLSATSTPGTALRPWCLRIGSRTSCTPTPCAASWKRPRRNPTATAWILSFSTPICGCARATTTAPPSITSPTPSAASLPGACTPSTSRRARLSYPSTKSSCTPPPLPAWRILPRWQASTWGTRTSGAALCRPLPTRLICSAG